MNTNEIINGLTSEFNNIDKVRGQLFVPQKVQLHPNIEGFKSPDIYGVYKNDGGEPLGVVGKVFEPMDLNVMLDSIVTSVMDCGNGFDLSTLKFKEYKGGAKVAFSLELPTVEIKGSPMVGDIIERKIEFRTGFDGRTKTSVTEVFRRVWCDNGCASTHSQDVAYKNTLNNHVKVFNLCSYITKSAANSDNFVTNLGKLSEIEFTQTELDNFLTRVTGYKVNEYKDLTTRKRNILDAINANIAIEAKNTGDNLFSVLNGITRYSTHDAAKGEDERLFYSATAKLNEKALKYAFAELN